EFFKTTIFDYVRKLGKLKVSGKSKASRRALALSPESLEIIERRYEAAKKTGCPWLFPSRTKKGHHITTLQEPHDARYKTLGVFFRLYALRHTYATELGEAGENAGAIAHALGHGSLRCVMKYVHTSDETADRVMRRREERKSPLQREVTSRVQK